MTSAAPKILQNFALLFAAVQLYYLHGCRRRAEDRTNERKNEEMKKIVANVTGLSELAPDPQDSATLSPSHTPGKFNMVSHRARCFINDHPLTREEAVGLAETLNVRLVFSN